MLSENQSARSYPAQRRQAASARGHASLPCLPVNRRLFSFQIEQKGRIYRQVNVVKILKIRNTPTTITVLINVELKYVNLY